MSETFRDPKVLARFWAKVEKRGPDDCWLWKASKNKKGYGTLGQGAGVKLLLAHRLSLEIDRGEQVPAGLLVLHRPLACCPSCVNPRHLRLGTNLDNMRDMRISGTNFQANKKTCPMGHQYGPTPVRKVGGGFQRRCYRCDHIREKRKAKEAALAAQ